MKVFITQSNYIPWKGYFDAINMADVFVLYDDMQYTKGDWRNRNRIKTSNGTQWLTIPIQVSGKFLQKICDTDVDKQFWRKKHWQCIKHNYLKTPFFSEYGSLFETLYLSGTEDSLSKINYRFLRAVSEILNIKTEFKWSDEFELKGDKTEKLVNICKNLNATQYISGPSARNYLNETLFEENGIEVVWMDYTGYPEYPQQFGPFDHAVSILDLLFNVGPAAPSFMKSFTS
jgi:hypothetical protein